MARFIYSELQEGEIRLFKLLPAEHDRDALVCHIFHIRLDSGPNYEAISYEWGGKQRKAHIETTMGMLMIHESLENALRSMRCRDRPCVLWADCISINQENKAEIDDQLLLLHKAYESADSTLVWLGNSTVYTVTAIRVLTSLALLGRQRNAYSGMSGDQSAKFMLRTRPQEGSLFLDDQDMILLESVGRHSVSARKILRRADLDDDEIFQFHDYELWREIDEMFWSTYFERTWIQQEVAKAPSVRLYRGLNMISWPCFHAAFVGRLILQFRKPHVKESSIAPLQTLFDARERWRDPNHITTLAGALVALAYSKEGNKHDHIYAAYAMTKASHCHSLVRNYDISIEELMRKTVWACIQERRDLYYLGLWCVASRKAMNLPSWAPDFTTGVCELACEHASSEMSRLINGLYEVANEKMYLNCHMLDTIENVYTIEHGAGVEHISTIISHIGEFFDKKGVAGLLQKYVTFQEGWVEEPPENEDFEDSEQSSTVESILKRIPGYSDALIDLVWDVGKTEDQQLQPHTRRDNFVIEALWSLLNPKSSVRHPPSAPPGEPLVLTLLYLISNLRSKTQISPATLPNPYSNYIRALIPAMLLLFARAKHTLDWVQDFMDSHMEKSLMSISELECIFLTSRGFLGRTTAGDVCQGDVVSLLGGGWTPYILQRQQSNYKIRTFAYVEGLYKLNRLPENCKIERIRLV